jgi:hypothetical protein
MRFLAVKWGFKARHRGENNVAGTCKTALESYLTMAGNVVGQQKIDVVNDRRQAFGNQLAEENFYSTTQVNWEYPDRHNKRAQSSKSL